ncbi:MAG: hypothetical protein ACRCXX_11190 [Cetobacterium sp.]|uniref:hypothetical protein n=1 Tax=Cetobacterium sp. TaxID=2071632 RepID=UPI003F3892AA
MTNIQTLVPTGPSYVDYAYLVEDTRITASEFKVIVPKLMPKVSAGQQKLDSKIFINDDSCKPSVSGMTLDGCIIAKSLADHRTEHYGDNMSGDTGSIDCTVEFTWDGGETDKAGPGPHTHPVANMTFTGEGKITVKTYSLDHPHYTNLNQVILKKGSEVLVVFVGNSLDQCYILNLPQVVVGDSKPHTRGGLYVHQQ